MREPHTWFWQLSITVGSRPPPQAGGVLTPSLMSGRDLGHVVSSLGPGFLISTLGEIVLSFQSHCDNSLTEHF